jgi:hypothetical protein
MTGRAGASSHQPMTAQLSQSLAHGHDALNTLCCAAGPVASVAYASVGLGGSWRVEKRQSVTVHAAMRLSSTRDRSVPRCADG